MARTVHLVRHAMPEVDAALPPEAWPLTADGRRRAADLGRRLPPHVPVLSSAERKAEETARALRRDDPVVDPRFGEIARPGEGVAAPSATRRRRQDWILGRHDARHDGWERAEDAAARFEAAIQETAHDDMVVVTHGLVMTVWLLHRGRFSDRAEAARWWTALALPDLVTVVLDGPAPSDGTVRA